MNTVKYAQSGSSGTLANSIGWIDFGPNFLLNTSSQCVNVSNVLPGGYVVSFDINYQVVGFSPGVPTVSYAGVPTPTSAFAPLGNVDYIGIGGNVALFGQFPTIPQNQVTVTFTLSNICVMDCNGCQVFDYLFTVADAAYTNQILPSTATVWSVASANSVWNEIQPIPSVNGTQQGGPLLQGLGTNQVTLTGLPTAPEETMSYVFITKSPLQIAASATFNGANAGFAFGIIVLMDTCNYVNTVSSNSINYIQQDCFMIDRIKLSDNYQLTGVVFGEATYSTANGPIVIEGLLAVYVIVEDWIFIAAYPQVPTQTFDFITLITQYGECTKAIPLLFEYVENK